MSENHPQQPALPRAVRAMMGYEDESLTQRETDEDAPASNERDTSVKKVASSHSPRGKMGQKYLASGKLVSMRLWEEAAPGDGHEHSRRYETVGYVLAGEAELHLEQQTLRLTPGDCWVVPKGALHSYRIVREFRAVEATAPPAEVHARDEG